MLEKNLVRVVRDHAGDGDEVLSGWQAIMLVKREEQERCQGGSLLIMLVKGRNKNVAGVVVW